MIYVELTINKSLDIIILLLSLKRHQIHTPLPTIVSGVEPAPFGVLGTEITVKPAKVVEVSSKLVDSGFVDT